MVVSNNTHRSNRNSHLEVHVTRGNLTESVHLVDAVVLDEKAKLVESFGEIENVIYPRSSIKMLQALSLVQSGAFAKYNVSEAELALACASHYGEKEHSEKVLAWLQRIGLDIDSLACGAHWPYDEKTTQLLWQKNEKATRAHNNCSGKHTGILTTCLHCGDEVKNYHQYDHPAQQRLRKVLAEHAKISLDQAPWGVDGCGIPTVGMPLQSLAVAMSSFLNNPSQEKQVILKSVQKHPHLISGHGTYCTEMIAQNKGEIIVKTGAEGVYIGLSLKQGLSIALKARDGGTRASRVALAALLKKHKALSPEDFVRLKTHTEPEIKNWEGQIVGKIFVPSLGID